MFIVQFIGEYESQYSPGGGVDACGVYHCVDRCWFTREDLRRIVGTNSRVQVAGFPINLAILLADLGAFRNITIDCGKKVIVVGKLGNEGG